MFEEFQGSSEIGPELCQEMQVSRTAVRLIVVDFLRFWKLSRNQANFGLKTTRVKWHAI